jgi:hypothetical protein
LFDKQSKKFTNELTGDYTILLVMCKDVKNKTADKAKLEQIIKWLKEALERDISKHEQLHADDVIISNIVSESKDPACSNILNLKCLYTTPKNYKFVKGVQIKPTARNLQPNLHIILIRVIVLLMIQLKNY